MAFAPSDMQAEAIREVVAWYKAFKAGTTTKPFFYLAGYAGAGKSTALSHALGELGLGQFDGTKGAITMTYTGKASRVLAKKGVSSRTIHSGIYKLMQPSDEFVDKLRVGLDDARKKLARCDGSERVLQESICAKLSLHLQTIHKPDWYLNTESPIRDADLIVLDECSMVDSEMASDILAFGKPVLALGDPGQLPPIGGEGYFTRNVPDFFLTEVHRQSLDSAVLVLATLARQGQPISFGQHDEFVFKMRRLDVSPAQMNRAGQVICAKNATRRNLNLGMRKAAGYTAGLPEGPGEKIICLKNRNDIGIVNGLFLTLDDMEDYDDIFFTATVTDEDGTVIGGDLSNGKKTRHLIYKGHFEDHYAFDKNREKKDWQRKRRTPMIEPDFANAITCHKSQGSQYENVVVYDEGFGQTREDYNRWLYTALTRSERGLVILA